MSLRRHCWYCEYSCLSEMHTGVLIELCYEQSGESYTNDPPLAASTLALAFALSEVICPDGLLHKTISRLFVIFHGSLGQDQAAITMRSRHPWSSSLQ
jgi:hypothetical protein